MQDDGYMLKEDHPICQLSCDDCGEEPALSLVEQQPGGKGLLGKATPVSKVAAPALIRRCRVSNSRTGLVNGVADVYFLPGEPIGGSIAKRTISGLAVID